MIHMPDPLANPATVNTLFIQPTYGCSSNCKDCYVKAHEPQGPTMDGMTQASLIEHFKWHANQITIAIDEPPDRQDTGGLHWHMLHILECFGHHEVDRPGAGELHITMQSLETLAKYFYHQPQHKKWDVVTFSHIPFPLHQANYDIIDHLKRQGTWINWNFMPPLWTPKTNHKTELYVARFAATLSNVNSCYFILRKSPVGKTRDVETTEQDHRNMTRDIQWIHILEYYLSEEMFHKINLDGCLKDVQKFRKEGFGCSAGISAFHVWPDGSVTGCPYAHSSWTGPANSTHGVIENIRKVHLAYKEGRYDFNRCHLPQTYGNVLQ